MVQKVTGSSGYFSAAPLLQSKAVQLALLILGGCLVYTVCRSLFNRCKPLTPKPAPAQPEVPPSSEIAVPESIGWKNLPRDIELKIFQELQIRDLCRVAQVCRHFYRLVIHVNSLERILIREHRIPAIFERCFKGQNRVSRSLPPRFPIQEQLLKYKHVLDVAPLRCFYGQMGLFQIYNDKFFICNFGTDQQTEIMPLAKLVNSNDSLSFPMVYFLSETKLVANNGNLLFLWELNGTELTFIRDEISPHFLSRIDCDEAFLYFMPEPALLDRILYIRTLDRTADTLFGKPVAELHLSSQEWSRKDYSESTKACDKTTWPTSAPPPNFSLIAASTKINKNWLMLGNIGNYMYYLTFVNLQTGSISNYTIAGTVDSVDFCSEDFVCISYNKNQQQATGLADLIIRSNLEDRQRLALLHIPTQTLVLDMKILEAYTYLLGAPIIEVDFENESIKFTCQRNLDNGLEMTVSTATLGQLKKEETSGFFKDIFKKVLG